MFHSNPLYLQNPPFKWPWLISIAFFWGTAIATEELAEGEAGSSTVEIFCPIGLSTNLFCFDCFTTGFCDGNGKAISMPCPAATPYCKDRYCSAERDPTWSLCDDQLLEQQLSCTAEGYFPEPSDCQQYHLCPDPTLKPTQLRTTFHCPANYVYDSINFKCKRKRQTSDCVTLTCTKANTFITYPGNENYYGFCKSSGGTLPVMFKCPAGQYFNPTKLGCEYRCTGQGYFAGPKCNQSYLCYKSGTQLVARLDTCPSGYLWNDRFTTCERDTTGKCSIVSI